MKIWKLLGFAVLVTAAATAMLTSTGVAAGQSKESVTLVWWHNATQGEGLKLWTSVASEFHKLHPDVTVKAVPVQNEQFTTKIPIALQSDSPPDVFQNWGGGQLVDQVKAGKVADLTKYVKPWIKSIGGSAAGWQVNGKQYAIPYSVGVVGFWYNKELFEQAGITAPPKTWPQFMSAISKLKDGGHHADLDRLEGQVAGCVLLGLPGGQALQQARHAVVGRDVQLRQPVLGQGGRVHAAAARRGAVPGRLPRDARAAGRDELRRAARERQGGDGAPGPLEPGRDAVADARPEGPELPRLVPVPERPGQQGAPRVDARRR